MNHKRDINVGYVPLQIVTTVAIAVLCTAFATDAVAACFSTPAKSIAAAPRLRLDAGNAGQLSLGDKDKSETHDSIVGMWATTFLKGDGPELWDQGFELFHSDGTELNVDNAVPPFFGNVCVGVWKQVGGRTIRLRHMTWNWDENGKLAGTFLLLMTVTVDRRGNSFSGNYVSDSFDLSNVVIPDLHAEGVVQA